MEIEALREMRTVPRDEVHRIRAYIQCFGCVRAEVGSIIVSEWVSRPRSAASIERMTISCKTNVVIKMEPQTHGHVSEIFGDLMTIVKEF